MQLSRGYSVTLRSMSQSLDGSQQAFKRLFCYFTLNVSVSGRVSTGFQEVILLLYAQCLSLWTGLNRLSRGYSVTLRSMSQSLDGSQQAFKRLFCYFTLNVSVSGRVSTGFQEVILLLYSQCLSLWTGLNRLSRVYSVTLRSMSQSLDGSQQAFKRLFCYFTLNVSVSGRVSTGFQEVILLLYAQCLSLWSGLNRLSRGYSVTLRSMSQSLDGSQQAFKRLFCYFTLNVSVSGRVSTGFQEVILLLYAQCLSLWTGLNRLSRGYSVTLRSMSQSLVGSQQAFKRLFCYFTLNVSVSGRVSTGFQEVILLLYAQCLSLWTVLNRLSRCYSVTLRSMSQSLDGSQQACPIIWSHRDGYEYLPICPVPYVLHL